MKLVNLLKIDFMRYSKILLIPFLVIILFTSESCKKTEDIDDYKLCPECTNEEISGNYNGDGMYFTDNNSDVSENVDINLNVNQIESSLNEIEVDVFNKFSKSYFVTREEGSASMTISGTSQSINITIYKKNTEYRINGTAKVYHTQADTLFIDHSVSFAVFK